MSSEYSPLLAVRQKLSLFELKVLIVRYPPSDACERLKDGLTALNYLEVSDRDEMSDVEEVREILGCPGVRALLQAHDVVAHEVYGEDAVRVTPPNSTVNLTVSGDEVEGPNGECPPVRIIKLILTIPQPFEYLQD